MMLNFILSFFLLVHYVEAQQKLLVSYKNCKIIETEWSDGDSFQISTAGGEVFTIRLYGADCIELHVSTDSDRRRLREQRRHFGITDEKGEATSSVQLAIGFGEKAKSYVARELSKPFIVHTRKSRAAGDGRFDRYYAFIETADGKDLAGELVKLGLARARGAFTEGPNQRSSLRYREALSDLELQAAQKGIGVWQFTNWEKLPSERDEQRKEDEEDQIAAGDALPADFRLNPNTAIHADLDLLPSIGPVLADRIIEFREDMPFQEARDLLRVPGIKEKTLEKISRYLDFKAR